MGLWLYYVLSALRADCNNINLSRTTEREEMAMVMESFVHVVDTLISMMQTMEINGQEMVYVLYQSRIDKERETNRDQAKVAMLAAIIAVEKQIALHNETFLGEYPDAKRPVLL